MKPSRSSSVVAALLSVIVAAAAVTPCALAQAKRQPLSPADIDLIARLVMLEDQRRFDEPILTQCLKSAHPELRRRAVVALARIANPAGRPLLVAARADSVPDIVATVAFASGQVKDEGAVGWLAGLLDSAKTPPAAAFEAARALGKIRTPEARAALAKYLAAAPASPAAAPVVGEALLAIGRFTTREDIAPIVRWESARDEQVRWRAAWALFRPRDPGAVPHLLKLADDPSAEVRFWAVRGLAPAQVTAAGLDPAMVSARLRKAVADPDRRVRTEALRALVQYDDDGAFNAALEALDSPDTWLSVSAAEGLARFKSRADAATPRLLAAAGRTRPTSLRIAALSALTTLAPAAAVDAAAALASDSSVVARTSAVQALQRIGDAGRARLDALAADPATKDLVGRGEGRRAAAAPRAEGNARTPAPIPSRPDSDYRQLVERWVVPDYDGAPKPRAVLSTPRGEVEIELYPGDAPLGLEYFVKVVSSGEIVGTEFGRVVPNFVAQQRTIPDAPTLRDEVSRRGLLRGTLSWASSGLDTGRPGYTLGSTPQPHNEGDFTALGRVVRGMDVVDHLELGDKITGAKMTTGRQDH
jgi:HEAT repeat protein/cyclophilin family peptidyl-prolyl cis-trans isomerase